MNRLEQFVTKRLGISDRLFELMMYLIMGVLTTIINIGTFFILESLLNMNYLIANSIAWFLSVLFAYISNKKYVFVTHSDVSTINLREMGSFFSFRLFSLLVDQLIMFLLIDLLGMTPLIVKIISNIVVLVINYIFSKFIIFKNKPKKTLNN